MPSLEVMTVGELDAHSAELKGQIETIRDQRRAAKAVRDEKVVRAALEAKLSRPGKPVSVSHLDFETVKDLYGIARQTPPGENDVVAAPSAATIDSVLGAPSIQAPEAQ